MVYDKTIEESGGGFSGIRDEKGISFTLDTIRNDDYYPEFEEKLTFLIFNFCSGHYFNDGNKRIALTLGTYFLHKNGRYWDACNFMSQLETVVYHIAASRINKDLLLRIIRCFLNHQDYDEPLKFDLMKAIGDIK